MCLPGGRCSTCVQNEVSVEAQEASGGPGTREGLCHLFLLHWRAKSPLWAVGRNGGVDEARRSPPLHFWLL